MGPCPGSANVQRPSAAGASWACKSPPGRQRAREAALESTGSRGPRAKPFGAAVSSARPSPVALLAQRLAEPVRGEGAGSGGLPKRPCGSERRAGAARARGGGEARGGVRAPGVGWGKKSGRGGSARQRDAGYPGQRIAGRWGRRAADHGEWGQCAAACLFLSFFLSATGREGAEEAAVRELRVRPLEPVAVCGPGRAARACGGGGERLGAVGGRGTAGLGRLVRVRGPDRPLRRTPRPAPCCMHAAGRSWDARQTAPSFRGGCSRAAPAAPRSRRGERRPPRVGPIPPREVQALGR